MIYLIGQLSVWLLLTAGFAALAGWMFAAQRAEPELRALRGTRERMVRDLAQLAAGDGLDMSDERDRVAEANDSLARIRESRIAELERALRARVRALMMPPAKRPNCAGNWSARAAKARS